MEEHVMTNAEHTSRGTDGRTNAHVKIDIRTDVAIVDNQSTQYKI
mgnify:CR=1 FL=1